ncbi:aspartate--tRNA ligase [Shimazuella sp. AN120528]|uniref:aspartate--tRNA ligase n=1 Tax=Shimazuella soli TaxID=1892854 RepID=UPI001F1143D7|nr:aspartate--tRNA ligase [Shimazuella soli]MCH5583637.1 aspartate--tRNA ligase [Shimazuella soli]
MFRTHYIDACVQALDEQVTINGWVQSRRDLGGVIFLDIRDRTGTMQVVFNPDISAEAVSIADQVRSEYVVSITGKVVKRSADTVNPNIPTGELEVKGEQIHLFNPAKTPPFPIQDRVDVDESVRLKYRYLDLRRPKMQQTLMLRHKAMQVVRRYLDSQGFVELETPILTKSTPEGARDYLVPSRIHKGEFYALPQSPQLFKQLFMVAGMERYFQIARCFRDEDLRADRQPEFTQIDLEMSFLPLEDLFSMMEKMFVTLWKETLGVDIQSPFPRIPYQEAMERYGSDKPDLRFGMELVNVSPALEKNSFQVFQNAIQSGGVLKAIVVPGKASWSRKEVETWIGVAQELGAKGLAWLALKEEGVKGSVAKFVSEEEIVKIKELTGASTGDIIYIMADKQKAVANVMGELRLRLGRALDLIDESKYAFAWITEFPLFELEEESGQYVPAHHPFTMPVEEDIPLLDSDLGAVRSQAHDLVLNGYELSSGSQRIYNRELQMKMFDLLGISQEEAKSKFGFLLDAFEFGAPPHGGMAFGFDRIIMLLAGAKNLRECIAFPKTASASDLMTEAPSEVDEKQLTDLHIKISNKQVVR